MTEQDQQASRTHIYFLYILLSTLLTNCLNVFHSYLLNIEYSTVSFITPSIAGILFGLLLAKNKCLSNQLSKQASIDILTGTYNRMQFNCFLDSEIDKVNRYGGTFSIIYIDLDHFKEVNDQYGHPAGDSVLKTFSDIVMGHNRTSDIFARYGGEEFIIITHEADLSNSAKHAERIRAEIEHYSFDGVPQVTCSFGVTEFKKDIDTVSTLIKRADDALYKAKKSGRNRVVEL
jgi:diguanylate cyclase (GGDEF)-like protein